MAFSPAPIKENAERFMMANIGVCPPFFLRSSPQEKGSHAGTGNLIKAMHSELAPKECEECSIASDRRRLKAFDEFLMVAKLLRQQFKVLHMILIAGRLSPAPFCREGIVSRLIFLKAPFI